MKKTNRIPYFSLALLLTLAAVFSFLPLWAQANEVNSEVASVKGTVTVKRAASEKTFHAFVGLKLKQGDVVTVEAGGEVAINIGKDKTVTALSDSSFKISNLTGTNADSQVGFTLIKGTVFNEVRSPQSSAEGLTVRTGNTVAGVRGTTYTVSLHALDGLTVHTLEGSVFLNKVLKRIESDSNASLVTEQQTLNAGQGVSTNRTGVYELTIADFTQAELEYITENPDAFPANMVTDAQILLNNLSDKTTTPVRDSEKLIIYEITPQPEKISTGGGGGVYLPPPIPVPPVPTPPVPAPTLANINYQTASNGDLTLTFEFSENITSDSTVSIVNVADLSLFAGPQNCNGNEIIVEIPSAPATYKVSSYSNVKSADTNEVCADLPVMNTPSGGPYTPGYINLFTQADLQNINTSSTTLGADYVLQSNIALTGTWTPIGDDIDSFTGGFYGNGHTISNLNDVNNVGIVSTYAGFFGVVGLSGIVDELTVSGNFTTTADYAGLLCGDLYGGSMSYCTAMGSIRNVSASGSGSGGITGRIYNGLINYSQSSAQVESDSGSAGGIAGILDNGNIEYSSNTGTVSCGDPSITGTQMAGGIAGLIENSGEVLSCFNGGDVFGSKDVGGIAGSITNGSISICANGGDISAYENGGGIVGYMSVSSLIECASYGDIIEVNDPSGALGGIAGDTTGGSISNCYVNVGHAQHTGTGIGRIRNTGSATLSNNRCVDEAPSRFKENGGTSITLIPAPGLADKDGLSVTEPLDNTLYINLSPTGFGWNVLNWDFTDVTKPVPID